MGLYPPYRVKSDENQCYTGETRKSGRLNQMKKRLMALLAAFCMTVSMIGSGTVVSAAEQKTKDEVIVTMPATSEPEAGFDPAYGWGA